MAVNYEKSTGDYVINGFERGIGDSMHSGATPMMGQYGVGGLGFMANAQIISVPAEASVNFATSAISQQPSSGNLTSADTGADTVTLTGATFDSGTAITFAGGGLPAGIVAGTVYWAVFVSSGVYNLYTDYALGSLLNITGAGSGTWATVDMGQPKYFVYDTTNYWMVDANGRVWSNKRSTSNSPFYWTYTGNLPNNGSHGNGLVYYAGYIFVFSNSSIDYTPVGTVSWVYQWSWTLGTTGSFSSNPSNVLKATGIHAAIVAPDNKVYFADGSWIGRWYQKDPAVAFNPATLTTYVNDETKVLPLNDTAQCLAPLGNNLLIGGIMNVVYPWDTFSQTALYPILLPEYNIVQIVTVNTTSFIFVGNRGRIYYTNGSQATLYKKIPDFISNTIEPYFTWGGAMSNKNQLYFSFRATTNAGTVLTSYGGVWAVDLDTKAIRLTNTFSYQSTVYNGYATALIPNFSATASGTGFFAGWDSNSSTYGIDTTTSAPYAGGTTVATTVIDSDLVPIGTYLKPTTSGRVEFKLSVPIVSGEVVKLQYRQRFADAFTDVDANTVFNFTGVSSGTWNGYAGVYQNVPFENSQWVQLRVILTSTASSPSYVRLTEMRLGN